MNDAPNSLPLLGPDLLDHLPSAVARPEYDRDTLKPGLAHIGIGAFHRAHQAEFLDDVLAQKFGPWGIVGINIRPPLLAPTLGAQSCLYTRLMRENETFSARVIGSIVDVVDSQKSAEPAITALSAPEISVISLTVTEKGYCHRPATGELDLTHPDIVHDIGNPEAPRSVPGILAAALRRRMESHGQPVTIISCDNIPSNGSILSRVVQSITRAQTSVFKTDALVKWVEENAAFPATMVDRIAPATSHHDLNTVRAAFGYADQAVVVGEPFRQWVIENRFVSDRPAWELAGATFVEDVEPFEFLKMRVLNGAQTSLCYLGVLAGLEHTCDDMQDPLLVRFVRRMLTEETLPTLDPVPGMDPLQYLDQSLDRLRNTAIRHRNHQIATDGSQKIVQRLLNPILVRLRRGEDVRLLSTAVCGWMVYLIRASDRFGNAWAVDDPFSGRVAAIADRVGADSAALSQEILAIDAIFDPELAANPVFRRAVADGIEGLLGSPMEYLRRVTDA